MLKILCSWAAGGGGLRCFRSRFWCCKKIDVQTFIKVVRSVYCIVFFIHILYSIEDEPINFQHKIECLPDCGHFVPESVWGVRNRFC